MIHWAASAVVNLVLNESPAGTNMLSSPEEYLTGPSSITSDLFLDDEDTSNEVSIKECFQVTKMLSILREVSNYSELYLLRQKSFSSTSKRKGSSRIFPSLSSIAFSSSSLPYMEVATVFETTSSESKLPNTSQSSTESSIDNNRSSSRASWDQASKTAKIAITVLT